MCLADVRPVRRSPDVQQYVAHARVRSFLLAPIPHFEVQQGRLHLDPGVPQRFGGRDPLGRVHDQAPPDQVLGLGRDGVPMRSRELKVSRQDLASASDGDV